MLVNGGTYIAQPASAKGGGRMSLNGSFAGVHHIFCPTDLTPKSQRALAFAGQLAKVSGARLTAFHSIVDTWLHQSTDDILDVKRNIAEQILDSLAGDTKNLDVSVIITKGANPSAEIVRSVKDFDVDLLVMKARPGISSALHFGSIVE